MNLEHTVCWGGGLCVFVSDLGRISMKFRREMEIFLIKCEFFGCKMQDLWKLWVMNIGNFVYAQFA